MKTMRNAFVGMGMAVWIAVAAMIPAAAAAEFTPLDISVRMGFDADSTLEYFHLYEINGRVGLPPHLEWGGGWSLKSALVIAGSLLHAAGDDGLMVGVGPQLELEFPWRPLTAFGSVRPSALSDHRYGQADLGGWFAFSSDLGLRINLSESLMIGYAWQHISNANIYDSNPGVDFHVMELSLKF
ncbi:MULTISPECIES: acyloxyacyl hydrolase [Desulfococcus]|jgi:hypothetical protein|uniref:Lipid A 3-O-deacylase-related protein n=1 Tax=Desulfococcus multivorans DSM 2059 TaxID=1121405 RepID=S7U0T1_DESML|nr:acyloxyacyl hydrolase [Desulfococcus multivorans]EPR42942.1 Lipid A 3-O-deacylase-related protein [Desulfococcus multivorans DSM 2059]MDX9818883.1 acyloxyacyl hydrolase [Desulfococcus multivorans]SJZ50949.1 Lipid A 3-O-deacylase (PagL) [Desulfococcus multivorans DSM 2059]